MTNGPDQKRKALGKGLSALLPSRPTAPQTQPPPAAAAVPVAETPVREPENPTSLPIDLIQANPTQPRTVFDPEKIEELAQSIRANGIIQPLIVRKMGDKYELIAGERRLRAARVAMLEVVPVVVQDLAEDRILEVALIENIQREDLNAIELAIAYDRLNRVGLSHEEIGRRTGKDRSSIANTIRLLKLPQAVQQLLGENRLSMGQARALLGLPDETSQIALAEKAVAQGLSARQVEALVRQQMEPGKAGKSAKDSGQPVKQDPNTRAAADDLERVLGTRVRIVEQTAERGRIEIEYYSQEDLMRIYEIVAGQPR